MDGWMDGWVGDGELGVKTYWYRFDRQAGRWNMETKLGFFDACLIDLGFCVCECEWVSVCVCVTEWVNELVNE